MLIVMSMVEHIFLFKDKLPPFYLVCVLYILLFINRSWVSLYFYVLCYIFVCISFCSQYNLNQWYQSNFLLVIS
jgi:hypothetical protein